MDQDSQRAPKKHHAAIRDGVRARTKSVAGFIPFGSLRHEVLPHPVDAFGSRCYGTGSVGILRGYFDTAHFVY